MGPALKSNENSYGFVYFSGIGFLGVLWILHMCGDYVYADDLDSTFRRCEILKKFKQLIVYREAPHACLIF